MSLPRLLRLSQVVRIFIDILRACVSAKRLLQFLGNCLLTISFRGSGSRLSGKRQLPSFFIDTARFFRFIHESLVTVHFEQLSVPVLKVGFFASLVVYAYLEQFTKFSTSYPECESPTTLSGCFQRFAPPVGCECEAAARIAHRHGLKFQQSW